MRLESAALLAGLAKTKRHGLPIAVEYKRGTLRLLRNDEGKVVYRKHMVNDYGFIERTRGRDGDGIDCFLGPLADAKEVYVVHMRDLGPDKDEREDEDKVMIGFPSADAAKAAFLAHYPASFFQSMTVFPLAEFKRRLKQTQTPYTHNTLHAENMVERMLREAMEAEEIEAPLVGKLSRKMRAAGFNENEPRDDHGKWTSTGAPSSVSDAPDAWTFAIKDLGKDCPAAEYDKYHAQADALKEQYGVSPPKQMKPFTREYRDWMWNKWTELTGTDRRAAEAAELLRHIMYMTPDKMKGTYYGRKVLADGSGRMLGAVEFLWQGRDSPMYIERLATNPEIILGKLKAHGVGTRLMHEVAKAASEKGVGIVLDALEGAETFYQKLGMTHPPNRPAGEYEWTSAQCKMFAATEIKASTVSMPKDEFMDEHKRLVKLLRKGSRKQLRREADDQEKEMEDT